jgi:hypothetical protein
MEGSPSNRRRANGDAAPMLPARAERRGANLALGTTPPLRTGSAEPSRHRPSWPMRHLLRWWAEQEINAIVSLVG